MQMHCSASLLKVTACHRCCWKNTGLIQPRNCFKIFESRWIVLSLPNLWFLLLKWDLVKHLVFPWHSLTQHQIWHFHYYGNLGAQSIETSHIKSKSECITEAEYHSLKKKHESLNFPSHTSKNLMTEKRPFCAVLRGFSLSRKTLIYSLNITH